MSLPSSLGPKLEELVQEAGRMAAGFKADLRPELKNDGSVVTRADREVEAFLRMRLPELHNAPVFGEEEGYADPTDEGLWLVDPVDGTANFRFGFPLWGVTVGLYYKDSMYTGAMCMPDMDISLRATRGEGAWLNGQPLPSLAESSLQPFELIGCDEPGAGRLGIEVSRFKGRHVGCFVAEAAYVATGALRGMVSTRASLYDAAASLVICREVGAKVTKLDSSEFIDSEEITPGSCTPFAILAPGVDLGAIR